MSEANTPLIGGNIANIERAKVVTIETSPKTYIFDTATSATYTAAVSSGEEKEQRCGNTLMGLLQTEDITKGYDLKLEDPRLIPEILALIDGGTLATTGESDAKKTTYSAPAAGKPVTRKKFDFYLYTSDREAAARYQEYGFDGAFLRKGEEAALVAQVAAVFRTIGLRKLARKLREERKR